MSFRFWRRVRLAPGLTLNLSKSTASVSIGPPGAKYTISPRGNRATAGLPGTGLFYTVHDRGGRGSDGRAPAPTVAQRDKLDLGFFRRLITPADERGFVDGLKALHEGRDAAALEALEQPDAAPDAIWAAGMIRLRREEFAKACAHFEAVLNTAGRLGQLFTKYDVAAQASLAITEDVVAHVAPCERGTRLVLVEIAQQEGRHDVAHVHLHTLLTQRMGDAVVLLSFAELALDTPEDTDLLQEVVRRTVEVENITPVDTAILLYRAKALAELGLPDAAIDVFTLANRRRKDRSPALLQQVRYERALLYEHVGQRARARREFEKLYAADPGFGDLAERLGLS
jgi:tetratricopeptide (TPR) repeat protein